MNKIKRFFTDKKFIYGSGSVATLAGFIIVAVLLNIIVGLLSDKFTLKADLTENKIYDLTNETVEIVKNLNEKIDIILFETADNEDPLKHELLQRYINLNSNLSLTIYDPVKDPTKAQKYQELGKSISSGSIVVDNSKTFKVISSSDLYSYNPISGANDQFNAENKITTALISLYKRNDIKVAFTEGHGETTARPFQHLLQEDNIAYENVSTLSQGFPEGYDMFIICSPQIDFTAEEIEAADAYLKKGKSLQLYIDYNTPPLPRLNSYLYDLGVSVKENIIFENDPKRIAYNTPLCFVPVVKNHPITSAIVNNNISLLVFQTKEVAPLWDEKNYVKVETLLESSSKSIASDQSGQKINGPFSLAVIASRYDDNNKNTGRVFVAGSSGLFIEEFIPMNKDFLLGCANWQIENIEPMNIRPKSLSPSKLDMKQQDIIIWAIIFAIFIPVIVMMAGLITWLRRRHL
ncbi:MAG: GldG family protein [Clostridiaceae bacterium]|nr:GldG family protein [Clostridiaceae bacterium]